MHTVSQTGKEPWYLRVRNAFCALPGKIAHLPKTTLFWAFVVPFLLTWLIYIVKGTWPFGNGSVLVLDLNGQYVYFYEEVQDIIRHGGSFLYTWQRALGGEFMGMYAYYVASPFTFLVALFPEGMITEAILFIILCKAGMCGLSMAFYITRRYPDKNPVYAVIFSTMYAMSAYAVVQAHNSMWIDELIWLPFMVYGIEQLIRKRRCVLYTAMLAISLLSNFYIGYMMCIFAAFCFFYSYFGAPVEENNPLGEARHFERSFFRMAVSSVVGVLISAIIVLPAYTSLQFGKNEFTTPSYEVAQKFSFLELLGKLYPGSYDTVRPEGLPFIYCGMLVLVFLPLFFLCRRVNLREKIAGLCAIGFFVVSFNFSTVDLIWHGFQFPNWLNYRYSFMLTFFLVLFSYRAFCEIKRFRYTLLCGILAIETLLLLIIGKVSTIFHDFGFVWLSLALIAAYALVLLMFYRKDIAKRAAVFSLAVLCGVEMFAAGITHLLLFGADVGYTSRTNYVTFEKRIRPAADYVHTLDNGFYRFEKTMHRMKNDTMQFDMNGISNSTSTLDAHALTFLNRLGYCAVSNWSMYAGGTFLTDSILGIKYLLTDEVLGEPYAHLYEKLGYESVQDRVYAYKNPYALSIGYAVSSAFANMEWSTADGKDRYPSAFDLSNRMLTTMLGGDLEHPTAYFYPVSYQIDRHCDYNSNFVDCVRYGEGAEGNYFEMRFTAESADEVFLFIPLYEGYQREVKVEIYVNYAPTYSGTYFGDSTDRILSVGTLESGDNVRIKFTLTEEGYKEMYLPSTGTFLYALDTEKTAQALTDLAAGNFHVTEHSDTRLAGEIHVPADRNVFFTTIPYDSGWHLYIDGVETETFRAADATLAADISAGTHTIEMIYRPKCFVYGSLLTLAGLCAFAGLIVVDIRAEQKRRKEAMTHDFYTAQDILDEQPRQ